MAGEKVVWGIDVGQCALKALKVQLVGDDVEAVAFDIVEHPKPLNPNERGGEAMSEALTQAVETLMSRNDMVGNLVVIGVPGYQAFTRFTKLPPVDKKQLPAIVQFEAGQQIPYDIDQVIWDYQIFSEQDSPDLEVGIFCMRTEQLDRYVTPFTNSGLQPIIVQPAPLALYNFLEHDAHRPGKATILLDIGAESTDLIVSDRGSVWTRAIPIGGNSFTERLVEAFRLEFPKAESLKRSAATSKYARQVFQAMRPVYQDLVGEIQRSVGRYSQTHREAALDKVVGMGNGFRLPGLQKFLQQNLGMKVERVSAFNALKPGPSLNAPTLNENVLSLGVAYGLAVQGIGRSPIASNLLPPKIGKRAVWRRKRSWFAAAAACLVLATASLWARHILDSGALERYAGDGDHDVRRVNIDAIPRIAASSPEGMLPRKYSVEILSAATSLSKEWGRLDGEIETKKEEVQEIMTILEDQSLWLKILDLVHSALPTEDGELVKAESLDAYLEAAKKLPRQDRHQILVKSFSTAYAASVSEKIGPLETPGGEAMEEPTKSRKSKKSKAKRKTKSRTSKSRGRGAGAREAGGARTDGRGFVITISGSTPYKNEDVLTDFRDRLAELGNPKDLATAKKLGFHVLIGKDSLRREKRDSNAEMRLKERALRSGSAGAEDLELGENARDPVTGEIWVGDWLFELKFGVVLGANPEATETSADAGTSGSDTRRKG